MVFVLLLPSLILILHISLVAFYGQLYMKLIYYIIKPILYLVFHIISEGTQLFLNWEFCIRCLYIQLHPEWKNTVRNLLLAPLYFFTILICLLHSFWEILKSQWFLQTYSSVWEGRGSTGSTFLRWTIIQDETGIPVLTIKTRS